jgi:hypothetical protein
LCQRLQKWPPHFTNYFKVNHFEESYGRTTNSGEHGQMENRETPNGDCVWGETGDEVDPGDLVTGLMGDVDREQQKDLFLGAILQFLDTDVLPADNGLAWRVKLEAEQCEVFNGLLYHHAWPQRGAAGTRTLARLAIPASRIDMVLHAHHDDLLAGHLGWN